MASEGLAVRKHHPENSILSLDKSDAPCHEQIARASQILNINLQESHTGCFERKTHDIDPDDVGSDPRMEWTLRWALKNMRAELAYDHLGERCIYYKNWNLIRELLRRCSRAKIAKVARDNDLVTIINRTLAWLRNTAAAKLSGEFGEPGEDSSADESLIATESDGTKERNRRGREGKIGLKIPGEKAWTGIDTLFVSVCGVMHQLIALTDMSTVGRQDYSIEHLEHAIRSSPDIVASILGSAFYLGNCFLQLINKGSKRRQHRTSDDRKRLEEIGFEPCLTPLVKLWRLSVSKFARRDLEQVDKAFGGSALVPSLQMLHAYSEDFKWDKELSSIFAAIQQLLTDHVASPHHQAFLRNQENSKDIFTETSKLMGGNLVKGLRVSLAKRLPTHRPDDKAQEHLHNALLSIMFSVAVKSQPRHNWRTRQEVDSWLESMFLDLLQTATDAQKSVGPQRDRRSHKRLVRYMLEICQNCSIRLSIRTLQRILNNYSGFPPYGQSEDDENPSEIVEWDLIGYCLAIDADVFTTPDINAGADGQSRRPNKHLVALLTALSERMFTPNDERVSLARYIMIPLLEGFAKARDLPTFITHWKSQLRAVETRRLDNREAWGFIEYSSIWEDETLLSYTSDKIEMMTEDQIAFIISEMISEVTSSGTPKTRLPAIVILDTIFCGLHSEQMINNLAAPARSAFALLLDLLEESSSSPLVDRWRVWKTLTAVTQRWFPHLSEGIARAATKALTLITCLPEWQLETIKRTTKGNNKENIDFREQYHAFAFLTSFTESRHLQSAYASGPADVTQKAISKILAVMQPFCTTIENDVWGKSTPTNVVSKVFTPGSAIQCIEALYLGCVSQLVCSTTLLGFLDDYNQSTLVHQAYLCALTHSRVFKNPICVVIDLAWPWRRLLQLTPLVDDQKLGNKTADTQISRYLQASQFDSAKLFDPKSSEYLLAFESLKWCNFELLDIALREVVANRLVRVLTNACFARWPFFTQHLTVLSRLAHKPSESMLILPEMKSTAGDDNEVALREGDCNLLRIVMNVKNLPAEDLTVDCVEIMRQLARKVSNDGINTVERRESIRYIRAMYHQVSTWLNHGNSTHRAMNILYHIVSGEVLRALHNYRGTLPNLIQISRKDLEITRQIHLESQLEATYSIISSTANLAIVSTCHIDKLDLAVRLDVLKEYVDLLKIHPSLMVTGGAYEQIRAISRQLARMQCQGCSAEVADQDSYTTQHLAVKMAELEIALCVGDEGSLTCIRDVSKMLNAATTSDSPTKPTETTPYPVVIRSQELQEKLDKAIQLAVSSIPWSERASCLSNTLNPGCQECHEGAFYIIRAIILSGNRDIGAKAQTKLSQAFHVLCNELGVGMDFRRAMLSMQCLAAFLHARRQEVRQSHIDTLFGTITRVSRRIAGQTSELHAALLFTGLTRLFGMILRRYRTRIGGRYPLVLSALQGLLRCLFTPYSSTSPYTKPATALTAQHVTDFARLLTFLCDPTPSAVSRPRKRSRMELNDETKKAKGIAGSFMWGLIVEYCKCSLEGKLQPEMKTALSPALWVVLDVIPQDAMRAMNESMGGAERSVFKALYAEYKRMKEGRSGR